MSVNRKIDNSFNLTYKKKFNMQSDINNEILSFVMNVIDNPPDIPNNIVCTIDDGISIVSGLIKNQGDGTQALTPSIQYHASNFESQVEAIEELTNIYTDIHNKHPNVVWIYTALNVNSEYEKNVSHQNWLCFNISTNTLYRFEPSQEWPEFKIEEFCLNLSRVFNSRLIQTISEINHNDMCKAYSSLMIIYFILTRTNIQLYYDNRINSTILNIIITQLGTLYNMSNNPIPKKTRRSLGYIVH